MERPAEPADLRPPLGGDVLAEPSGEAQAAFLSELSATMLTASSTGRGVEEALVAMCRFIGVDMAAAYLIGRDAPYDIADHRSVTVEGEMLPRLDLPLAVRASLVHTDVDDGLLVLRSGPSDIAAARRFLASNERSSLRVFRWFIDDEQAAMVSMCSRHSRRWAPWQIRVLRTVSRFVAHGLARTRLERALREQRDALAASEHRLRHLVASLPAAFVQLDVSGTLLLASRDAERFGLTVEEMIGRHVSDVWPDETVAMLEPHLEEAVRGARVDTRVRVSTPGGDTWCDVRMAPELDERGVVQSILVLSSDATERGRIEARVARAASTDSLTGLANRMVLVRELERTLVAARDSGEQVALLFIDLDKFKAVNDALGHLVGDELLRRVGERLRAVVRSDDVVARLGGDEFAILLTHVRGVPEVEGLVEQIRAALARPIEIQGRILHTSGSIGVALSTPHDRDASDLLRCADHAMYQAKQTGRNRAQVFDDAMRVALGMRAELEAALRGAIDDESIDVHYLPEIDLATGRVVALEALARWRHDDLGLLPASAFVGLAEDAGLIADLGAHVLTKACHHAAAWRSADGPPAVLRVNLSARQLRVSRLVGDIAAALVRSGLEPHRLCVEVSEASLVGDMDATLDVLRRVHELGVLVSIDDFGTGHAAFAHLEQLPVDALKVDRRFISAITGGGPRALTIVESLVNLGRALGVHVIAEGVETAEQLETLRAIGCQRAQGHYFSDARPAADVARLLEGAVVGG